jgi:hypothetical protein
MKLLPGKALMLSLSPSTYRRFEIVAAFPLKDRKARTTSKHELLMVQQKTALGALFDDDFGDIRYAA